MDRLLASCQDAENFPGNLVYPNIYPYSIDDYVRRLAEQQNLFSEKGEAALDFWEFDFKGDGFRDFCAGDAEALKQHLHIEASSVRPDPCSRFVFVHARQSRDRLSTTRYMLMLLLSYHQTMPSFLEFLFSYGFQEHPQDFYFAGFRHDTRLNEINRGLMLPELGRSGRDIQLCFSLKSVERSVTQKDWPWSIRHTAVYHSFDMETARATWIVLKGDQKMKKRVKSATGPQGLSELSSFGTTDGCFASTLATHLIFCDWAGENWRWYTNFLDNLLEDKTRSTLATKVESFRCSAPESMLLRPQDDNLLTKKGAEARPMKTQRILLSQPPSFTTLPRSLSQLTEPTAGSSSQCEETQLQNISYSDIPFSDLQRIQFLQEKVNESLLVLKLNMEVLTELNRYYQSVVNSADCPKTIKENCADDLVRFKDRLVGVQHDMQMHQWRMETLLKLCADRKAMMHEISQYRNTEAHKLNAQKSQLSSDTMEIMTTEMHNLAIRTTQETVSMKIITLVTLFFLPGTFVSTFMSTDIVRFQTNRAGFSQKIFSLTAFKLYLIISLPLTLISFVAWYGLYRWLKRKNAISLSRSSLEV